MPSVSVGMLRFACTRLTGLTPMVGQRAGYKNFVMSEALAQMEQECERYSCFPRFPDQKVTVVGAGSDVGRIASLFLKQQNIVKVLAMYDDVPERRVIGAATDIGHIDTTTAVEAYQGRSYLKAALYNADVVLICGGSYVMPPCCNIMDRDLFFYNMQLVRTVSLACAHFCPHATIAIQTPPVDCNFTLCKHTLDLYHVYDKKRLFGVNSVNSMRANQLFSDVMKSDPADSFVPVICGTGRCTRVPVFSATKSYYCLTADNKKFINRIVREADELICKVKSNTEQGHLSIGFATARFVVNLMKGLFEKPAFIDSALVEQDEPDKCYGMEICATPVTVGSSGIMKYEIPKLTSEENDMLEESKVDLEDMLNLGRCYATGDEYSLHPGKFYPCYLPPPCEVCEECKPRKIEKKS